MDSLILDALISTTEQQTRPAREDMIKFIMKNAPHANRDIHVLIGTKVYNYNQSLLYECGSNLMIEIDKMDDILTQEIYDLLNNKMNS